MIKLVLHENGKLKELKLSWKVVAALLFPFSFFLKLIAKWVVIFAIAVQGLFADPADEQVLYSAV